MRRELGKKRGRIPWEWRELLLQPASLTQTGIRHSGLAHPLHSLYPFKRRIIRHAVGELNQAKFVEAWPRLSIDSKDEGAKHE
jgi:hypothetical protein